MPHQHEVAKLYSDDESKSTIGQHQLPIPMGWKISNKPKTGDRVTYGKYAGQKLVINGVRFLLLNDDEITSILPDDVEVTAYL